MSRSVVHFVKWYGNYLNDDRDLTWIPELSHVSQDFLDSQLRLSLFLKANCLHSSFHWFLSIFNDCTVSAMPFLRLSSPKPLLHFNVVQSYQNHTRQEPKYHCYVKYEMDSFSKKTLNISILFIPIQSSSSLLFPYNSWRCLRRL